MIYRPGRQPAAPADQGPVCEAPPTRPGPGGYRGGSWPGTMGRMIVDNAFASPLYGLWIWGPISLPVYQTYGWPGPCMGGAVLCDQSFYDDYLQPYHRHMGPSLTPIMLGRWQKAWKLWNCA